VVQERHGADVGQAGSEVGGRQALCEPTFILQTKQAGEAEGLQRCTQGGRQQADDAPQLDAGEEGQATQCLGEGLRSLERCRIVCLPFIVGQPQERSGV
jgi:hypothetical protein